MSDSGHRSPFIPVLLLALSLNAWFAFQTYGILDERRNLDMALGRIEPAAQNAAKMRTQLDAIAADLQRLANSGNKNAVMIIDDLRRQGITFNAEGAKAGDAARW